MNNDTFKNRITIITNETRDLLLDKSIDALALYLFYIKCCDYQETNQVWATDTFCMKGLGISKGKFYKAKKLLLEFNLVEMIPQKNNRGRFDKFYVKVNYLFTNETKSRNLANVVQSPDYQRVENPESGKTDTNALSNYNLNALSNLNSNACNEDKSSSRVDVKEILNSKKKKEPDELRDKINGLIARFEKVNPLYKRLYANTAERTSMKRLLEAVEEETLIGVIDLLPKALDLPFAPVVTSPYELEKKYVAVIKLLQKHNLSPVKKKEPKLFRFDRPVE